MVYTERTDKCLASSKDNATSSKSPPKTQPPSPSSSASSGSGADKWKYNNMVKDNREKFNDMHFS